MKQKKKKLVKKIDKKKIIFGLVLLVVVYFLFKPKKDVLQDWEEMFGVSSESNPDDLNFEEWNELQPEIYRHDPEILARLRDCPYSRAELKDPYNIDIYTTTTTKSGTGGCNRKTGVSKISIIIQNHDFKKGVKEFKAWLKKNKLKLGKDVVVEDYYPYTYGESTFAKFLLKNSDWNDIDVSLPIIKGEVGTPREIIEVHVTGSDHEKIIKEFDSFVDSLSNEHVYMYYGKKGPTIEYVVVKSNPPRLN